MFTNKMVDASKLLPYTNEELGLSERVQLDVLLEVAAATDTEDKDALRRALAARRDELVPKHITVDDIFASVNYLLALSHGIGKTDDIDHLGNRRLRSVGELLLNQLRIGFSRMDKIVKEKMTTQDIETVTPQSLINIRPIVSAIRDFFGSSPLSQFMDQTNPLSELTHKRRLSALGPGASEEVVYETFVKPLGVEEDYLGAGIIFVTKEQLRELVCPEGLALVLSLAARPAESLLPRTHPSVGNG